MTKVLTFENKRLTWDERKLTFFICQRTRDCAIFASQGSPTSLQHHHGNTPLKSFSKLIKRNFFDDFLQKCSNILMNACIQNIFFITCTNFQRVWCPCHIFDARTALDCSMLNYHNRMREKIMFYQQWRLISLGSNKSFNLY